MLRKSTVTQCLGQRLFLYVTLKKLLRQFWIQLLQPVVLLQRAFAIIQRDISKREIEMRFTIIRFDPDRFLKRRRCFLVTLGPEIDGAEIVVCLRIRRLQRERLLVSVDRRLELLILVKRSAETVVRVRIILLRAEQPVETQSLLP